MVNKVSNSLLLTAYSYRSAQDRTKIALWDFQWKKQQCHISTPHLPPRIAESAGSV